MMDGKLKYSKMCAFIENAIDEYIPKRYVDVMFDDLNYIYYVKIKNQFGVAEYQFLWSTVMSYGVNYVVATIQADLIYPKEGEE